MSPPSAQTLVPVFVVLRFMSAAMVNVVSAHAVPLPSYPTLHVQVLLPAVFAQVALTLQPPLLVAHSSTSVHVVPLPE